MDTRAPIPTSEDRAVLTVPEAGALVGLGRAASYDAARRGDLPTIKIGRRMWVPTAKFRSMLGLEPAQRSA